jgi:predicted nucleotidyltransferase
MLSAHIALLRPAIDPRYLGSLEQSPEPATFLLGSATAAAVVALLSLHPGEEFPMADLELATAASYESLHRTLRRLEAAGVLVVDRSGRRHTATMPPCPSTSALRSLTLELGPLGSRLRWCRGLLGGNMIEEAFVFGSIAAGTAGPRSDLDLLVVGDVSTGALLAHMAGLADQLARQINPVCHTRDQVDHALSDGLSFMTTVFSGPRIQVVRGPEAPAVAAA